MQNAIIFGIGNDCQELFTSYPNLLERVVAFTADTVNITELFGKPVIKPTEIKSHAFDIIVIASSKYILPIFRQCYKELNNPFDKIISADEFLQDALIEGSVVPAKIRIDACTLCQLDCTGCYMRLHDHPAVGDGYLKFENFKKLVDENPEIKSIELSNNGEPFLNPEMKEILEYAYENNIQITFKNGTNFNTVSDAVIETLVKTKVRFINFSIDGTNQEIYSAYRRNGYFDKVIENIKRLNYFKSKYKSEYPILQWQFILMEHNQHQVLEAKNMAEALNMRIYYKLDCTGPFVPHDPEFIRSVTGLTYLTEQEVLEKTDKLYNLSCRELFDCPAINYDGKLLGCCRVSAYAEQDFDVNVFELGLKGALQSKKYQDAKRAVLGAGDIELCEDNPCGRCYAYRQLKKSGQFLKREDIRIWKENY